jgi:hypothetical protein
MAPSEAAMRASCGGRYSLALSMYMRVGTPLAATA